MGLGVECPRREFFGQVTEYSGKWGFSGKAGIGVEDDATCAWNLWSGIYYKANNELWRLTGLAANAYFVGISFRPARRGSLWLWLDVLVIHPPLKGDITFQ